MRPAQGEAEEQFVATKSRDRDNGGSAIRTVGQQDLLPSGIRQ